MQSCSPPDMERSSSSCSSCSARCCFPRSSCVDVLSTAAILRGDGCTRGAGPRVESKGLSPYFQASAKPSAALDDPTREKHVENYVQRPSHLPKGGARSTRRSAWRQNHS